MQRQYPLLRAMLARNSLTQLDLARQLGRSYTYVNRRMAGHKSWTLNEVQEIARWLQIPRTEFEDTFFVS